MKASSRRRPWGVPVLLILLLLAACGPSGAAPTPTTVKPSPKTTGPALAGQYDVSGTNPDGSVYTGTLEITLRGDALDLHWYTGQEYFGVGLLRDDVLAVGWGGANCSAAAYRLQPDGGLDGQWVVVGSDQIGAERAVRDSAGPLTSAAGDYSVTGGVPGGQDYTGKLTVIERGEVLQFQWQIGDYPYDGIGFLQEGIIAVGWGDEYCGFVSYRVMSENQLDGVWGVFGEAQTGTERATRQ